MLPFDFIVIGTPLSHQTRDRQRLQEWMRRIKDAATDRWPEGHVPDSGDLRIIVRYFHERPSVRIDVDNLVKPIQDALIGLVYVDDVQIIDVDIQKRDIDGSFRIRRMSPILAEGFINGEEFVYVRIEHVTDRSDIS